MLLLQTPHDLVTQTELFCMNGRFLSSHLNEIMRDDGFLESGALARAMAGVTDQLVALR